MQEKYEKAVDPKGKISSQVPNIVITHFQSLLKAQLVGNRSKEEQRERGWDRE